MDGKGKDTGKFRVISGQNKESAPTPPGHEKQCRSISSTTIDGIIIIDEDNKIIFANPSVEIIFGFTHSEMLNKQLNILIPKKKLNDALLRIRESANAINTDPYTIEIIGRHKRGKKVPLQITFTEFDNEKKSHITCVIRDISERKNFEKKITYLATHDAVTGLPNRNLLSDRMSQSIAYANRNKKLIALLLLDVDDFKTINSTLGHKTGDQLLKSVADRLKNCIRKGDTIARLAGDEFVIMLPYINESKDVITVVNRIQKAFSTPVKINKHEIFVTAGMGISVYPHDGDTAGILLKNADIAMYKAKELGRNNHQFYSTKMNAKVSQRLAMETDLRHAVQREEFVLHYQPLINSDSGQIIGAEALIRWMHPRLGLISPLRFIPLAEETGLIIPIGEWVLRTACKQNKKWQDQGLLPIPVSVNFSAYQFSHIDFIETIVGVLDETNLEPKYLELELTESVIMKNEKLGIEILNGFKKMGLYISIDDFGTGYSSLSHLRSIPLDKLKIDQSFISNMTTDTSDMAIVKTIILMAKNLNLKVIAEGVETKEQMEYLREQNCTEIQGFYYSPPVSAEEFELLLKKETFEKASAF